MHPSRMLKKVLADENAGEVLESALLIGLIVIICLVIVGAFGVKVLGCWNTVDEPM